jgi:mevalonate kinase
MDDLTQLGDQINMMKSETLAHYGKKVDVVHSFIEKEKNFIKRNEKIFERLNSKIDSSKRKKRKKLIKVKKRIDKKIDNSKKKLDELKKLKEKYIKEYKMQRESLGLIDHSFIDEFYRDKE